MVKEARAARLLRTTPKTLTGKIAFITERNEGPVLDQPKRNH